MKLALFAVLVLLSGCTPTVVKPTSPFQESVHRKALEPGKSTISGQGFLRTNGGDVKYAAGSRVLLIPVTPHLVECLGLFGPLTAKEILVGRQIQCDPRIVSLSRTTQADGEGRFKFKNVSAGRFWVETNITWYAGNSFVNEGGDVGVYVTVENDGDKVTAIVTR